MTDGPQQSYREMALAVGLVVVGSVVALVGSHRNSPVSPGVPAATGSTGSSAPAALALVALAAVGALLLVRNRARTALGAVLALDAAGLVVVGVTPTRWATLIGAACIALGALATVARARTWPQPRRRFDTASRDGRGSPHDAWDALDRGEDPTA